MKKIKHFANKVITFVDKKKHIGDMIIAALLAMCPVLQHYKGPLFNMAITVLVFAIPYLFLRMLSKINEIKWSAFSLVAVAIIYQIYRIIDHGTSITEFGQSTVFILYLIALSLRCVDLEFLLKAARVIAMVASALLILQYICFYIFKFHLQLVPTSLLLPSADQWVLGAKTGLAGITGRLNDFYRPSAFFLEPSHVYIYMFPHLFLLLFGKGGIRKRVLSAGLISLGMVLTTSAMGFLVVVCAWVAFLLLYNEKEETFSGRNIFRKRNLIAIGILVALFVAAVIVVPTVRRTVTRIFATGTGVTAISGRINRALKGLKDLNIWQWIFGVADTTRNISYNVPGAIGAIYRHGLIGFVLSMEFYTRSLFKQKMPFFFTSLVILITSFFSAHTHSTVGMLYYIFILMYGYQSASEDPTGDLKAFFCDFWNKLREIFARCIAKIKGAKNK